MLASTTLFAILLIMVKILIVISQSASPQPITEFDPSCGLIEFEAATPLKLSQ